MKDQSPTTYITHIEICDFGFLYHLLLLLIWGEAELDWVFSSHPTCFECLDWIFPQLAYPYLWEVYLNYREKEKHVNCVLHYQIFNYRNFFPTSYIQFSLLFKVGFKISVGWGQTLQLVHKHQMHRYPNNDYFNPGQQKALEREARNHCAQGW